MSKKGRRGRSNRGAPVVAPATTAGVQATESESELSPPPPEALAMAEQAPEPVGALPVEAPPELPVAEPVAAAAAEIAAAPPEPAEEPVAEADAQVPSEPVAEADAQVPTEPGAEAAEPVYETVPRDDSSYPPVDLDNHFFERAHRASDPPPDLEERDPRMALKATAMVAQRRAHLARYVKMAVAGASVLCLAALVKVAVARSSAEPGAKRPVVVAGAAEPTKTTVQSPASPRTGTATATETAAAVAPPAAAPAAPVPAVPAADPAPAAAAPAAPPEQSAAPAAAPPPPAETAAAPADPAAAAPEPDPKAAAKEKNTCRAALERGKLADAIESGEKSVALDPTDAEAWLILGAAYQEKGNMKDARRCYKACIEQGKRGPKYECMAMPH